MKEYMVIEASQLGFRLMIREEIRKVLSESGLLKVIRLHEDFLDIDQAATLVRLKKSTLYGMSSRHEIPSIKKGKRLLFRRSELLEFLESGRKVSPKVSGKEGHSTLINGQP